MGSEMCINDRLCSGEYTHTHTHTLYTHTIHTHTHSSSSSRAYTHSTDVLRYKYYIGIPCEVGGCVYTPQTCYMCNGLGKGVTWDWKVKCQLLYATVSPAISQTHTHTIPSLVPGSLIAPPFYFVLQGEENTCTVHNMSM